MIKTIVTTDVNSHIHINGHWLYCKETSDDAKYINTLHRQKTSCSKSQQKMVTDTVMLYGTKRATAHNTTR